jgi:choline dehydrogenase/5-(hydroxymethyl)furfural/furfural oxidase
MQEHPLALFWLFHRTAAAPELDARQTNCCLRYSSGLAGAGENDMMIVSVNQTLAAPLSAGTWGVAGGGHIAGGPGLLCIWVNQQQGRGWLKLASDDPDAHPLIQQDLLYEPGDLVRMRDGVKRALAFIRTGAVRRGVRARRDRHDGPGRRRAVRRRRDRRLADGDRR